MDEVTIDQVFDHVLKNSKQISEDFFNELFERCPSIQFKFERLSREDMFRKAILMIKEGDKPTMVEIGKAHGHIKGLTRKDFCYFSTCLFNVLITHCYSMLSKSVIKDLNTSVDKAIYCVQEGFHVAKALKV